MLSAVVRDGFWFADPRWPGAVYFVHRRFAGKLLGWKRS